MATQGQLGQVADSVGDTPTTLYTLAANTRATGLIITVTNVTASDDDFRITQDDNGTVGTIVAALYWDVAIAANTTVRLSVGPMDTATGTIRVSSSTADAVTFTLHGVETNI